MEKKISYLNRNFQDYRESLINFSKEYYPTLTDTFNDLYKGGLKPVPNNYFGREDLM